MKKEFRHLSGAVLSLGLAVATFSGAFAQDAEYLNSDPIDINGYVKEAPSVTDHELESVRNELQKQTNAIKVNKAKSKTYKKLSNSTEKLADATEEMIEERKESQVTIDKFNKKIECLMATGITKGCEKYQKNQKVDEVSTSLAAPVIVAAAPGPEFDSKIKILTTTGLTNMMSENEELEATNFNLKIESDVSARFSVGLALGYRSMKTEDFANSGMNLGFRDYYNSFYGGREINYTNYSVGLTSKFYPVKNSRFRPYLGAGLSYNRSVVEYTNNDNAANGYGGISYGYTFGNEDVVASSVSVEGAIGTDVIFTDSIGMNIELQYSRGIGSKLSSESARSTYLSPDQQRLENLSDELAESNNITISAGLLVQF